MIDKQHLLNSQQMAEFVARGFLRFDELVPAEINEAVMRDIDRQAIKGAPSRHATFAVLCRYRHAPHARSARGARLDPEPGRRRSAF